MKGHLELVVMVASYYRQRLDDLQVRMYAEDLAQVPLPALLEAFRKYRQDSANVFMPMPSQLLAIADPKPTERDEATDLAVRMMACARQRDYTWANTAGVPWPGALITELGETAHLIVTRWGGWRAFCASYWDTEQGVFRAQLRDMITSCRKLEAKSQAPLLGRVGEQIPKLLEQGYKKNIEGELLG